MDESERQGFIPFAGRCLRLLGLYALLLACYGLLAALTGLLRLARY